MVGLIFLFQSGMFWKRRAAISDSGAGVLAVVGFGGSPRGRLKGRELLGNGATDIY